MCTAGLIYEDATVLVSQDRRHLFVTPLFGGERRELQGGMLRMLGKNVICDARCWGAEYLGHLGRLIWLI